MKRWDLDGPELCAYIARLLCAHGIEGTYDGDGESGETIVPTTDGTYFVIDPEERADD